MTASLKKGRAKPLSFWREEPRRGKPEGESLMSLRDWAFHCSGVTTDVRVMNRGVAAG